MLCKPCLLFSLIQSTQYLEYTDLLSTGIDEDDIQRILDAASVLRSAKGKDSSMHHFCAVCWQIDLHSHHIFCATSNYTAAPLAFLCLPLSLLASSLLSH